MGRGQTLAVDLGGTHMRVAVVDPGGRVLDRRQEATPHDARRPVALVDLVRSVLSGPSGEGVAGAVVGTAGSVDYHGGCLDWAPHLPEGWLADLAETRLSAAIGLPVALANDADLAAVGEAYFGAGRGVADVAYVTVSTGIGAGVVLGGRLVHGRLSLAEIGHTVIDRAAFQAGRPATVELLGSGSALDRLAREAGRSGGGAEVDRLAAAGDAWAAAAWDGIVAAVGIGILNLVELFSPEVVVVGGGVGLSGPGFLGRVQRFLSDHGPDRPRALPQVVRAALGDDAALAGAAAWHSAFAAQAASRP